MYALTLYLLLVYVPFGDDSHTVIIISCPSVTLLREKHGESGRKMKCHEMRTMVHEGHHVWISAEWIGKLRSERPLLRRTFFNEPVQYSLKKFRAITKISFLSKRCLRKLFANKIHGNNYILK